VASILGISVAELLSGGYSVAGRLVVRAEVPLVPAAHAGEYAVIDNFESRGRFDKVPLSVEVRRYTYALRVQGDSMVCDAGDSFPEGSIIVVEPEMKPQPGNCVIVLNAANETTFKRLVKDGSNLYLKPLNARYLIKPLGAAKVIGVVREFNKRFR
jgi:SOS-response transcriptional repressor LexA